MAIKPRPGPKALRGQHLMTPAEAAKALRLDPKAVTRLADAGKLRYLRTPGGHRRFFREDIEGADGIDWGAR